MAPRTLIWMADASLSTTASNNLWANSTGGGALTFTRTASPGSGLRFSDKGAAWLSGSGTKNFTANATVLACCSGSFDSNTSSISTWNVSFWGDGGTTQHITVGPNGAGKVEVRRGNTAGTILATGTTTFIGPSWFHLQIEVTISDTVGTVKVRVNGNAVEEISFTGDTKNAGTASTIDRVVWSNTGGNAATDDMSLWVGTGDWPGDQRIYCLLPSGNGTTSQGTGSDSDQVNNYLLVDERPESSTDYVSITTDNDIDLYAVTDLPAGVTTVHGVQTNIVAAKSDAGAKGVKIVRRSGGTNYIEASSHTLSTTYVPWSLLDQTDPATSATWTASAVNGLEVGWQATAS
jgi:hypothetical protein